MQYQHKAGRELREAKAKELAAALAYHHLLPIVEYQQQAKKLYYNQLLPYLADGWLKELSFI